jgi:16S rRNA processing protein RimM
VAEEPTVAVGRIVKAHGVHGEVALENRSDNPDRWLPGSVVLDGSGRLLTVRAARPHQSRLLVTFEEVSDRTAAEALVGATLVVPESWLPDLDDGQWWAFEAQGLEVRTEDGRELGRVQEVLAYPAHDLWRIVAPDGAEVLLPVVDDLLVDVDVDRGVAVVRALPGLTAPEA